MCFFDAPLALRLSFCSRVCPYSPFGSMGKRKQTEIDLPTSVVSAEIQKRGERYVLSVIEEADEEEGKKSSKQQCREHSFVKKVPLYMRDNGEFIFVCRLCGYVA